MYTINRKKITNLKLPKGYDAESLQIGIPATENEKRRVSLNHVGDTVLPSADFGIHSRKNAYGFEVADKTKDKELRHVSTNWIYPFGNSNASHVPVDVSRKCFPKKIFPPLEIELVLFENKEGQEFIIANLTEEIRKNYLKETVNLFVEIFGYCNIYDSTIRFEDLLQKKRCNWEILPQGELPSRHLRKQLEKHARKTDTYDIFRLEFLEQFQPLEIVEGINGFSGYYAYVFENYCVLESAVYGNATYIIPRNNWEILSQKTKKELFDANQVIARYEHNAKWQLNIVNEFNLLGI